MWGGAKRGSYLEYWFESEHKYTTRVWIHYDVTVYHVGHYATKTPPTIFLRLPVIKLFT